MVIKRPPHKHLVSHSAGLIPISQAISSLLGPAKPNRLTPGPTDPYQTKPGIVESHQGYKGPVAEMRAQF